MLFAPWSVSSGSPQLISVSLDGYTTHAMTTATVTFHKLIQDTQDLATANPNENHMVSRAFFTLQVGDAQYPDMSVVLRQPFGTDYASEPVEVEKPSGSYNGNWDHNAFRDAAEDYYRGAVGAQGRGIRLGPNVQNIRMRNNTFGFSKTYKIQIP
jgi:hypothetical protein